MDCCSPRFTPALTPSACPDRGLPLRALCISLALHAVVLAALVQPFDGVERGLAPAVVLRAVLPPAPAASPPPLRGEPVKTAKPPGVLSSPATAPVGERPPLPAEPAMPPAPSQARSVSAEVPMPAGEAPGGLPLPRATPAPATLAVATPEPASRGPDAAGLRQYRLALAGEARRFRRYPEAAQRAGIEGRAEVRVTVTASGGERLAELARSSGHAQLDEAALDMLRQAAQRTHLPDSLRGQGFAVLLPVVFAAED